MSSINELGTVAVGSVNELANLLTNMSPEELQNVRLDPALYNAISQTIDPVPQTGIQNLNTDRIQTSTLQQQQQPQNLQVFDPTLIEQVSYNVQANFAQNQEINSFNRTQIQGTSSLLNQQFNNGSIDTTQKLQRFSQTTEHLNTELIPQEITHLSNNYSASQEQSTGGAIHVQSQQLILSDQGTVVQPTPIILQDLSQLQGILPGQSSSLIVTPTVMSQVQPTATVQTVGITDGQVFHAPLSNSLPAQSFITPVQTVNLGNTVVTNSLAVTSLYNGTINITPNIVSNNLNSIDSTNIFGNIPAAFSSTQNQQLVINGNTVSNNATQQLILPDMLNNSNQQILISESQQPALYVAERTQQPLVNNLPQQAVILPNQLNANNFTSAVVVNESIPSTNDLNVHSQPIANAAVGLPQLTIDNLTGNASIVLDNGAKVVLSPEQLTGVLNGSNTVLTPQYQSVTSTSATLTPTLTKQIVKNSSTARGTVQVNKPSFVVKTVISKEEAAKGIQVKPKSVEQVQPGVFKVQLAKVNVNSKTNQMIINKQTDTITNISKVLNQSKPEIKKHKFHDYSVVSNAKLPSIKPPGYSSLAQIKQNIISTSPKSPSVKVTIQSMNIPINVSDATTVTQADSSTSRLLEMAKKINLKAQQNAVVSSTHNLLNTTGNKINIIRKSLPACSNSPTFIKVVKVRYDQSSATKQPKLSSLTASLKSINNTATNTSVTQSLKTGMQTGMNRFPLMKSTLTVVSSSNQSDFCVSPENKRVVTLAKESKMFSPSSKTSVLMNKTPAVQIPPVVATKSPVNNFNSSTIKKNNTQEKQSLLDENLKLLSRATDLISKSLITPKQLGCDSIPKQKKHVEHINLSEKNPQILPDTSLECKEKEFHSPPSDKSVSPKFMKATFSRSFKKPTINDTNTKNAIEKLIVRNTKNSKVENEAQLFRETIKSSQIDGENAMRNLAMLEIENQMKRFSQKNKSSAPVTTESNQYTQFPSPTDLKKKKANENDISTKHHKENKKREQKQSSNKATANTKYQDQKNPSKSVLATINTPKTIVSKSHSETCYIETVVKETAKPDRKRKFSQSDIVETESMQKSNLTVIHRKDCDDSENVGKTTKKEVQNSEGVNKQKNDILSKEPMKNQYALSKADLLAKDGRQSINAQSVFKKNELLLEDSFLKKKEEDTRKRERPRRFDDFVISSNTKKIKKTKKFFFPKENASPIRNDDGFEFVGSSKQIGNTENETPKQSSEVSKKKNKGSDTKEDTEANEITSLKTLNLITPSKVKNKQTKTNKSKTHSKKKKKQISVELEVLPQHLKTKSKPKNVEDTIIDLSKVKLKSAFAETSFKLNDTVDYKTYKALSKSKLVCTFCGKPGNIGTLDVLFGPYKLKVKCKDETKNIVMSVWLHRDCAIWTSSVCLSNQLLAGLGDALEGAAKTTCSLCSQVGATLECGFKQCRDGYHFVCAKQRGCSFKLESFTIICPKHR